MFFSKIFYPLLAIAGIASVAFAIPVAKPVAEAVIEKRVDVEVRQVDSVPDILNGLANDLDPIFQNITSITNGTGGSSSELSGLLSDILSLIQGVTVSLGSASPIPTIEITAVFPPAALILGNLVETFSGIGGPSDLNGFLSGFTSDFDSSFGDLISVLGSLSPRVPPLIGLTLPHDTVIELVSLGFVNIIGLLDLGGVLAGPGM